MTHDTHDDDTDASPSCYDRAIVATKCLFLLAENGDFYEAGRYFAMDTAIDLMTADEKREHATDLLANLRHWCDANDVAFHKIDRMAHAHYLAEKAQPETSKIPAPQAQIASPVKFMCSTCGSDDVLADAYVEWNGELQMWEVQNIFDKGAVCNACGGDTTLEEVAQ